VPTRIPALARSYAGPALLMLDNRSSSRTGDLDDLVLCDGVIPIFLPPRSSTQTWILDLSILP
jgi:hypothetical protein